MSWCQIPLQVNDLAHRCCFLRATEIDQKFFKLGKNKPVKRGGPTGLNKKVKGSSFFTFMWVATENTSSQDKERPH